MAIAIPLALMAASAAASASAQRKQKKAANSAKQLGNEGRAEYLARNQVNLDSLLGFANKQFNPADRAARWDRAATDTAAARTAEIAAAPQGPKMSTEGPMDATQLAWAGKQAADEGQRMHDVVRLLSKASAPQTAGFREGIDMANFGSNYSSRAQDARNMLSAYGTSVDERVGNIGSAGASQNLLASLFAQGAGATAGMGGGMMGGIGGAAHRTTGIPRGYPHVG